MKKIHIGDEARGLLKQGVTEFVAAVKSTLGPAGNNVMIHSRNFLSGYTVTKDGVTVANEIRFSDPVKDMAALIVRQASRNTAKSAGDGTTTSAVFAEALINAFDEYLPASGLTRVQFAREVKSVLDEVKKNVSSMSKDMTPELVRSVSMISSNGDEVISNVLSEAFSKTDVIDVIESDEDNDVVFKMVEGMTLERGWAHEFFINNERSRTTVFEKPLVLVYDGKIKQFEPMQQLLRYVMDTKRPLVIISHLEKQALETLLFNVSQGFRAVAIEPPLNGHRRLQLMKAVCKAIGATYFSDQTGDDLGMIKPEDLGSVEEITVSSDDTILKPSAEQLDSIKDIINDLKENPEVPEDEKQEFLRLVSGGYGQVKVGGSSQAERKERKDRVDDAVCAIRSARRKGVVPGGGVTLIHAINTAKVSEEISNEACLVVETACESPLRQMLINFGLNDGQIDERLDLVSNSSGNSGWNLYNMEWCESMFDAGIVDPTEVTLNVIDNGFSIASVISTTNTVITDEKSSQ